MLPSLRLASSPLLFWPHRRAAYSPLHATVGLYRSSRSMVSSKRALRGKTPQELDSSEGGNSKGAAPPSLSKLIPKACLTCGRIITPRSNWAKNWAEIKYCSDACRKEKRSKMTISWIPADPDELQRRRQDASAGNGRLHWLKAAQIPGSHEEPIRLNIEEWIEAVLLYIALANSPKRKGDPYPTGEDAENIIKQELDTMSQAQRQSSGGDGEALHPVRAAVTSHPGLRERVRRALRRLAVLPASDLASSSDCENGSTERRLYLRQGKRHLLTLDDVSFAKGPIEISSHSPTS